MAEMTFYHQARQDGDVRSGLSIDDTIVFERYVGKARRDPALRWFVDVRCEGRLSTDPEEARQWLLDHADVIKTGLKEFSNKLEAGLDDEAWPVSFKVGHAPRGTHMTIVCSAIRRLDARDIATNLATVAVNFEDYVKALRAVASIGR